MTQEQKDLLLKDLCARLSYGVKVKLGDNPNVFDLEYRIKFAVMYGNSDKLEDILDITNIKPYLFPLSSMTEEQKEEYYSLADDVTLKRGEGSYFGIKIHCIKLGISDNPHEGVWDDVDLDAIDWLNKNHFDYRGLIPMGLAIDATGLNIY
jgi:hypothetical protein